MTRVGLGVRDGVSLSWPEYIGPLIAASGTVDGLDMD
jgi:hypothetical protein